LEKSELAQAILTTFTVDQRYEFAVPADKLFAALTVDIGEWWLPRYLRDGARDIRIGAIAGGWLEQPLKHGGGFVMAEVQEIVPNKSLVLQGSFGIPGAIYGRVAYSVDSLSARASTLRLEHYVIGQLAPPIEAIFVKGWALLLDASLRAFVEKGEAQGVRGLG
jgi:uncharacterized protein YndB with AHSA1/START domain